MIYTGKIVPTIQDIEYNDLFNVYSFKKRNYQDIHLYFILDYYENPKNLIGNRKPVYSSILNAFNIKYKKEISKATISDIILGKLIPLFPRKVILSKKKVILEDKIKLLSKEQLLLIMSFKSIRKTTQDVTNYISEHYSLHIKRDIISKLWKNEIELSDDIKNTQEYVDMVNYR